MDNNTDNVIIITKDINAFGNNDDNVTASSAPRNLVEFKEQLYFVANDGETGEELWVSDGTEDGTRLLKNINADDDDSGAVGSNASNFLPVGDKLYFVANDGETGEELWVSDGTENGTKLIKDIRPLEESSYDDLPGSFPENLIELNGKVYFSANDGQNGRELWVSDGTTEGTQLLKDIAPGDTRGYFNPFEPRPNGSYPNSFAVLGDQIYFAADNHGEIGRELWVSDGTTEGTKLLKDIYSGSYTQEYFYGRLGRSRPVENPIPFESNPDNLITVGEQIFFSANDGKTGNELWVSDGTASGTQLVADISPGENDEDFGSYPQNLFEFAGKLYFSAKTAASGRELWVSDGTQQGTRLVKDINDADDVSASSYPQDFIEFNGKVYFTADDGVSGRELWVTDGTTRGTQLVQDIDPRITEDENAPVPEGSEPRDLTVFNNHLYFSAQGAEAGRELRVSDGTSQGTSLVQDLNLGFLDSDYGTVTQPAGANPDSLTVIGDTLFFSADDGAVGTELFRISLNQAEQEPTNLILGTESNDNLVGASESEQIEGLEGNDNLRGAAGADTLDGGAGNDLILGNSGNDTLVGQAGLDTLVGGAGADVFVLRQEALAPDLDVARQEHQDLIFDFESGVDRLGLADGLTIRDLRLAGNTISVGNEVLANLEGIDTTLLTEDDFISF